MILENERIRATFLPQRGGKLASLITKRYELELLSQPPEGVYPPLWLGMPFEQGDASGMDDVFPSMGDLPNIPDHGVVWTTPMGESMEEDTLVFTTSTPQWRYEKRVTLVGDTLRLAWHIQNTSTEDYSFVWVSHGLWALTPDTQFFCADMDKPAADVITQGEPVERLSATLPLADTLRKHYLVSPVSEGLCGFTRDGLRVTLRFDPITLPYLGLWVTNGGWRGDHNFAWEPSTSYFDTLKRATQSGTQCTLAPWASYSFWLSITIEEER